MAKRKRNGGGSGHFPLYRSYVFRDKDPVIDELRDLFKERFGKDVSNQAMTQVHAEGGPSITCMHAWFFGKTQRPQNPTIEAAGRAMGFKRVWRKMTPADK